MKVALVFFILFVSGLAIVQGSDGEDVQTERQEDAIKDIEDDENTQTENQKDDSEETEDDDHIQTEQNQEEDSDDAEDDDDKDAPQDTEEDIESFNKADRKTIKDIPGLTEDMLKETINEAKTETLEEQNRLRDSRHDSEPKTHQSSHYKRFVPELEPGRIGALIKEKTIKKLAQKLGMNDEDLGELQDSHLNDICQQTPNSAASPRVPHGYRSIDGEGNNVNFPNLGRTNTRFSRILRADYGDRISSPRKGSNQRLLPNARKVSSTVFKNGNRPSEKLSHMAMIWGQFLDHDITLSAEPHIECGDQCGLNGECFGIPVPNGDRPFRGRTCIQLKRSVPSCKSRLGRREQINTLSSFIDGSAVYSSDPVRFNSLRDPSDSALLVEQKHPFNKNLKNLLSEDTEGFCRITEPKLKCFRAGDVRTNENSGLASMHTIMNREHNRIVKELRSINPHWGKDKLFFEARKIIGALVQHITYNEFLPLILNETIRNRHQLVLKSSGFYSGYRSTINPSIFNSFSAAAYRFGHSLVQNMLNRFGKTYHRVTPSIPMNRFFDTVFLYQNRKGGVDSIVRGLATDKAQTVDGLFAKAVQEQLRRGPHDLADLPALNIQRGRDHGIPGYNQFREVAGLKKANKFEDLGDLMTKSQIKKLEEVYKDVNDIDLFVGGVLENHVEGGSLGPTFSKIIAMQFRRLRRGDRFWYENQGQFTGQQLQQIRKASLARVICDNSDDIKTISRRVLQVSTRHTRVDCRTLPKVDLIKWNENVAV